MTKDVSLIIPMRMNSTRLPNKLFLKVQNLKIIDILMKRVGKVNNIKNIIIATTNNESDKTIVEYCNNNNIKVFRGSEKNVYDRFKRCSDFYKIKHVCRLTSDNPLFDFNHLSVLVKYYQNNDLDYVKTIGGVDGVIEGEVFNIEKLDTFSDSFSELDREHVTKFIYENKNYFKIKIMLYQDKLDNKLFNENSYFTHVRITLDTIDDFKLIENIVNKFYQDIENITIDNIIEYLANNDKLLKINDSKYKISNINSFIEMRKKFIVI